MTEPITAREVALKILEPWKEAELRNEFNCIEIGFGEGAILNAESDIKTYGNLQYNKAIEEARTVVRRYDCDECHCAEIIFAVLGSLKRTVSE